MRHKIVIPLALIGIVIIFIISGIVGFEDIIREILKSDISYLFIFLLIQILMIFLWALKWRVMLIHYDVSFKNVLLTSSFGYLMNNLTPIGGAGGEPFRAYLLARVDKISTENSMASVILDLFSEVLLIIVLLFFAISFLLKFGIPWVIGIFLGIIGIILLVISVVVISLMINKNFSLRMIQRVIGISKRLPIIKNHAMDAEKRIDEILANFLDAMKKTMANIYILWTGIFIALIIRFISIFRMYLIFKMLGTDVPLMTIFIVQISTTAIVFLSFLPGALGIWEGISTWLFTFFNIAAPTAMAAILIERIFSYWIGSLIGLISTMYLGATYYLKKYFRE